MPTSPSYVNPRSQNRDLGHLAMGGAPVNVDFVHPMSQKRDMGHPFILGKSGLGHPPERI